MLTGGAQIDAEKFIKISENLSHLRHLRPMFRVVVKSANILQNPDSSFAVQKPPPSTSHNSKDVIKF
jgi:hypothetical protein